MSVPASENLRVRVKKAVAEKNVSLDDFIPILHILPCFSKGLITPGRHDMTPSLCNNNRQAAGEPKINEFDFQLKAHFPNPEGELSEICANCKVFAHALPALEILLKTSKKTVDGLDGFSEVTE